MTIKDIEACEREVLTCADVAEVLSAKAATLHDQAVERPDMLGFPVIVAGSRVKIPRRAFLRFMAGEMPLHAKRTD